MLASRAAMISRNVVGSGGGGGGYRAHTDAALIADYDPDALIGTLSNGAQVASLTATAGTESGVALAQATSASQPIFNTAVKNGHSALTFDNSNDYLDADWAGEYGPSAAAPTPLTVFCVARSDHNADVFWTGLTTNVTLQLLRPTGSPSMRAGSGSGGVLTQSPSYTSATWGIWVCVFNQASSKMFFNSTTATTSGTVGDSSGTPVSGSKLDSLRVGASNTATNPFSGQICRLMFVAAAVSDANIATEVAALASEYAITI